MFHQFGKERPDIPRFKETFLLSQERFGANLFSLETFTVGELGNL